jgi:sugar (pentulose or hexulose) kinase
VIRLRPEVEEPEPSRAQLYGRYRDAYRKLYPATAGVMGTLSELATDFQAT